MTVFYDCPAGSHENFSYHTLDEAVEMYLDGLERDQWPETVEVSRHEPRVIDVGFLRRALLEHALEAIDDEFGDPDGGYTDETPRMKEAEETFIKVIIEEYGEPWACDEVSRETINVREWVEKNNPHWLEGK